jgi:hypothetical protein
MTPQFIAPEGGPEFVEVELVAARCPWGNGLGRITLLIPSTPKFLITEAVPKGFGLKVVVEVDLVTVRCPWGNGHGRITLLFPNTPRFLIAEVGPESSGLTVVLGVAVADLHGWRCCRAADERLISVGGHVVLTVGPVRYVGRQGSFFAVVKVSFRAPIADHRRAVSALQV